MGLGTYFSEIWLTCKSVVVGMSITLKYAFQPKATVRYPERRLALAPRYRGIHEFEADKCIACDLCAKACPVDCIYIDKTGPRRIDKETGLVEASDARNGQLTRFAIDYSKCLFCALCTEPCPTLCIHMGKLHDLSTYTRAGAVVEFTQLHAQGRRTPLPLWVERQRADIPWVNDEYDRIVAGNLATNAADIPSMQ